MPTRQHRNTTAKRTLKRTPGRLKRTVAAIVADAVMVLALTVGACGVTEEAARRVRLRPPRPTVVRFCPVAGIRG